MKKRTMVRVEGVMEKGRCGESGGMVVVDMFGEFGGSEGIMGC